MSYKFWMLIVKLSVILILRLKCVVLKKNVINVSLLFSEKSIRRSEVGSVGASALGVGTPASSSSSSH